MIYSKTWLTERTITIIGCCLSDWALPLNIAYSAGHLRVDVLCFFLSITFFGDAIEVQ